MFKQHVNEYYQFSTGEEYKSNNRIFYDGDCTPILYKFGEIYWMRLPKKMMNLNIKFEDCTNLTNRTIVGFINETNFGEFTHSDLCRKLTKADREIFNEFHDACSVTDKDIGQVSIDDPVAYGAFVDGKIVAVSSLWHFGETLSDVGILTHPEYRKMGYAEAVCKALLQNENRLYVWRSESNPGSKRLSEKLGFEDYGEICVIDFE